MEFDEQATESDSWENDLDVDLVEDVGVVDEDYVSPLASEEEAEEEYVSPLASGDVEDIEEDIDFEGDIDSELSASPNDTLEGVIVLADDTQPSTEVEFAKPLSVEEATELTEHIRSTSDMLYVLVSRAHAGQAHVALGYKNFESYVKEEFSISRSRAYQFINQANVIAAIEAAAPEGTNIKLNEAAARDLKNLVDELTPEIRERTEGLSPEEAGAVVEDLVKDFRDRSKAPIDEDDDFDIDDINLDDIDFDLPEFDNDSPSKGGGSEFDDMEDFDNLDGLIETKDDGFNEDPSSFRNKVENVYAFYTALTALEKMPEVDEIIGAIPDARKPHIDSSLPKALAWLQAINDAWEAQKSDEPVGEETEDFDFSDEEDVREEEESVELDEFEDDSTDIK